MAVDIPGNILSAGARVPRASNLLANRAALEGQRANNALAVQARGLNADSNKRANALHDFNLSQAQQQSADQLRQRAYESIATIGGQALEDPSALSYLEADLTRLQIPPSEIQLLRDPKNLQTAVNAAKAKIGGVASQSLPAGTREFNALVEAGGLSEEDTQQAARVALGLDSRAGSSATVDVGGVPHRVVMQGNTPTLVPLSDIVTVAGNEGAISGARQAATEQAETDAIPERTRVETLAEDFAEAPQRLRASQDLIHQVGTLEPVFERVLDNADIWSVGFLESVHPGGSPAADMAADLKTLGANAAFDRLQQMRDSSPTGGALGQVSERELALLESTIAAIAQSQSPEQFRENVMRLQDSYKRIDSLARQAQELDRLKVRISSLANRPPTPQNDAELMRLEQQLYAIEDRIWSLADETGVVRNPPARVGGPGPAGMSLDDAMGQFGG